MPKSDTYRSAAPTIEPGAIAFGCTSRNWVPIPEKPEACILLNAPTITTPGSPPSSQQRRMQDFRSDSMKVPAVPAETAVVGAPEVMTAVVPELFRVGFTTFPNSHAPRPAMVAAEPESPAAALLREVKDASRSRLISRPILAIWYESSSRRPAVLTSRCVLETRGTLVRICV